MGTFNTHKILNADPSLIPAMSEKIVNHFKADGYEVDVQVSSIGTHDISLTKGGMFKAVLGLKTALKVTLKPEGDKVSFDAGIGIFGQQLVPSLVMFFVAWPVMITQLWGLVQQSNLDDQALVLAESVVPVTASASNTETAEQRSNYAFCPSCGYKHEDGMRFCPNCGGKL